MHNPGLMKKMMLKFQEYQIIGHNIPLNALYCNKIRNLEILKRFFSTLP